MIENQIIESLNHFFDFFVFYLETLIHFVLLFITVAGLKILTTMPVWNNQTPR